MRPAASLLEHRYPRWLLRHPACIHLLYAWNLSVHPRHRLVRRVMRETMKRLPGGSCLLDAGCGEGMHLYPLARRFSQLHFTGLDRLPAHIAFGRACLVKWRLANVELHCGAIEDIGWEARFDLVLCSGTLQYLPDDERGLERLRASLRPGGTLLLYVPVNGRQVLPGYRVLMGWLPNYEAAQQRRRVYQPVEIVEKLERVGFVVEEWRYASGTAAILATELYNTWLMLAAGLGPAGWLVLLLGPLVVLPVWALQLFDVFFRKENGNGLLVKARRAACAQG